MATGTNGIATEGEAKIKLGYNGSVDTNKCCTKARAIAMGADSSKLTSYKDNQLVKYSDLYQSGLDPNTAPNGVYICDNKGRLWKKSDWNTSNNTNAAGVAVKTDNCAFVIAKVEYSTLPWGGYGLLLSGVTTTEENSIAQTDYKGSQNTDAIVSQLGTSYTYAARYCEQFLFPHGKNGYLPALGEWDEAYKNKSEVDTCMSLIGGKSLNEETLKWCSTQYNDYSAWDFYWENSYFITHDSKTGEDNNNVARPFAPFL